MRRHTVGDAFRTRPFLYKSKSLLKIKVSYTYQEAGSRKRASYAHFCLFKSKPQLEIKLD